MPDDADELILKMQHLEAQAREQELARTGQVRTEQLKTRAQKMALEAQQEVASAEEAQRLAEEKQEKARDPATPPIEAADLLIQGKAEAQEAHARTVKARARLNFALDKMDEAERREWEALQADARAEAHGQLAEDPLFNKPPA
jgi:hypothetical protein